MEIDDHIKATALKNGAFFGFIPQRLEISWQPEWHHFPFNVLFMSQTSQDGQNVAGSALYEPEFHTYRKDGAMSLMKYRNVYGDGCHLMIAYDASKKQYRGEKYVNGKLVGAADGGNDWQQFFVHLTLLGLSAGEKCQFEVKQ